jgi:hypothetical protein
MNLHGYENIRSHACFTLSCFIALCIDASGMLHFFACAIMLDSRALNLGSGPPPSEKFKYNIN